MIICRTSKFEFYLVLLLKVQIDDLILVNLPNVGTLEHKRISCLLELSIKNFLFTLENSSCFL